MDWICFVFKRMQHIYLVADDSLDSAWETLAKRQSISVKNCKRQYNNIGYMNGNGGVWKI